MLYDDDDRFNAWDGDDEWADIFGYTGNPGLFDCDDFDDEDDEDDCDW